MANNTDRNCFRSQGGAVVDMTSLSYARNFHSGNRKAAGPLQVEADPPVIKNRPERECHSWSNYFYD